MPLEKSSASVIITTATSPKKHVGFRLERNEYSTTRDDESHPSTCVDSYNLTYASKQGDVETDVKTHVETDVNHQQQTQNEKLTIAQVEQRKSAQKNCSQKKSVLFEEKRQRENNQPNETKHLSGEASQQRRCTSSSDGKASRNERAPIKSILKNCDKHQAGVEQQRVESALPVMRESRSEVELRAEVTEFLNSIGSTDSCSVLMPEKQIRSESSVNIQSACAKLRALFTKCAHLMNDVRLGPEFNDVNLNKLWFNPMFEDEFQLTAGSLLMQRKIGSGSFGVVYYAIDKTTNKEHAVKCVRKKTAAADDDRVARSQQREFYVWRETTDHPNIITLYAAFESSRAYCFVMDYVKTGSLSRVLRKNKLTDKIIEKIAAQLAHAIHTMHRLGFLHRDISCSNILITPNFDVRLSDFGISAIGLTATTRCGSLAYMAPEVLACRTSGPGADWWSYGIVLFTMFEGMTPLSLYVKRWNIDLNKLSKLNRYEVAKNASVPISPLLEKSKKDLLKDIFRENPSQRLGVRHKMSFQKFKDHQYFQGVDWAELDAALAHILQNR